MDLVVIDESSFKSASSQRFKALKKVRTLTDRMVARHTKPNGYLVTNVLLDGERLGKTTSATR